MTAKHEFTVRLSADLKARLARTARRRGVSMSEMVRISLDQTLDPEPWSGPRPRPIFPLYHSGDPTLSERVDEALQGFGEPVGPDLP